MARGHPARLGGRARNEGRFDMARETGLNRNAITLLYKETARRVELDALDKLCKLFSCGVGDLFKFDDDQGR
ncbi:helix-turn-helix transcriptional regulator [Halomonas venusta]|uniref:helix-turn-helix domain-containing protein n=1 Tax=Vreelandella venusta TaxID=44935 RepID=UPI00295F4646|nr:helix-turn-helix transcriptional regulator [Halomonas venusta]MDW0360788.1 helix-turn-helix transcriptional regulator [Halomonas venusta]